MKVAVPVVNDKLSLHFGHCETFRIFDVDMDAKKILGSDDLVPPPHEPGVLPKWLGDMNTNAIIAGGMGMRAQQLFDAQGIQVIVGASADCPARIVQEFLDGTLATGANACDH